MFGLNFSVFITLLGTIIFTALLIMNFCQFLFSLENYNTRKNRLNQLKFEKKKEMTTEELIDTVTKPIITHIIDKLKPKSLLKLEREFRMIGWSNHISPKQFKALNIIAKSFGLVMFLLLWSQGETAFGVILGVLPAILPNVVLTNQVKDKKAALISEFPDVIRITQGYLSAGQPLVESFANSLKFIGEDWKPIIKKFIINCDTYGEKFAIRQMKEEVDIFEVKEFASMLSLTLEQGGQAKDSFEEQAENITELLQDSILLQVAKRKTMAIMIQAPLLMACIVAFGLPTMYSMMNLQV